MIVPGDAPVTARILSADLEPKPKEIAKKRPKHPDEVELARLTNLKLKKKEELEEVTKREDRYFEKERNKAKNANDKAYKRSNTHRSKHSLKQSNSNGKSTKSRSLRKSWIGFATFYILRSC